MFEKIADYFWKNAFSNPLTYWLLDDKLKSLTRIEKQLNELNNNSVMEYRKIRWTVIAWVIALVWIIITKTGQPAAMHAVPYFIAFVVFWTFGILLDFQYDIHIFRKQKKVVLGYKKLVADGKKLILSRKLWRKELEEIDAELLKFDLPETLWFVILRSTVHIWSIVLFLIGAFLILKFAFQTY